MPRQTKTTAMSGKAALPQLSQKMLEELIPDPVTKEQFEDIFFTSPESAMAFAASDVVPITQARATLSDLVEQVNAGAERIITKNGESYVAIIDSRRLDYYHQLGRERIHLLIDDTGKGLDDIAVGKVKDARSTLAAMTLRRAAKTQA